MANGWGNSDRLFGGGLQFSWAAISLWMLTVAMKSKDLLLGRRAITNLDSILKSRDDPLPTTVYIFSATAFQ